MKRSAQLALLWLLYFVQGLPFGFQVTAVPVLLRERGASLTVVSLAGLVSAPWILKPLWAPWVDRAPRRKAWLVPMQVLLAAAIVAAGTVGDGKLGALLATVLLMNGFAATLDVAVDGLAIDMLEPRDLGIGNAAQVVGYKLGMLAGGGLMLWCSARIGEGPALFAMAAFVVVSAVVTAKASVPPRPARSDDPSRARPNYRATVARLLERVRSPAARWLLVAVLTYKLGESIADTMFKPFLVDAGFDRAQIGLWLGTWGMAFSLAGSLTGGWLATRWSIGRALALFAVLRVAPLAAEGWLVHVAHPEAVQVIVVTCAEHFFGGGLTTAMFALMMSRVDRDIGATHFTALAALEVLGKAAPGLASGPLTDQLGYEVSFALAVTLSLLFLGVLPTLRRGDEAEA